MTTKELIKADCSRYYGKSDFKIIQKTKYIQSGFKYIVEYRKINRYIKQGKKGLGYYYHRIKFLRYSKKTGFQIGAGAEIGPGLFMNHRGTVIVNGKVKMGRNINLSVGVTIGQENRGKRKGVPTIGNEVWIGNNAVIVGKIQIGNNVLIAPNAYVNFDVPDNSIVIGNPAKIILSENATEGYIQNPYKGR